MELPPSPLLEPSEHGLLRHEPAYGARMIKYTHRDLDLMFVINAVVDLPSTHYCEWNFMGPEGTAAGEVVQIQELWRVRARKVGRARVEVATCAFLKTADDSFGAHVIAAAVGAMQEACKAQSAWEVVYVGEF